MEITTTPQLEEYLSSQNIPFTSLVPLTAGGSNYSWRVQSGTSKSIIKHATPYLKILKRVKLPIERQSFEVDALSSLSFQGDIQLPRLLFYDKEAHVIQSSDAGSRNLAEALSDLDLYDVGTRIGAWLALLHSKPTDINNDLVELKTQHCALSLPGALQQLGLDGSIAEKANSFLFDNEENKSCQCHGDFFPSNIVVADGDSPTPQLTVIDWEWARRGNGAFDVGLFAGEVWLLEFFRNKRGLFESFLAAYIKARPLSLEDTLLVAARLGVHFTYWATQERWGPSIEVVNIGLELLRNVLERDLGWLKQSFLKVLFESFEFSANQ